MRAIRFKRKGNERVARPVRGVEYRIIGDDRDYTLTFNGSLLANSDRIDLLRDLANMHLIDVAKPLDNANRSGSIK